MQSLKKMKPIYISLELIAIFRLNIDFQLLKCSDNILSKAITQTKASLHLLH